jgi:hypothetical protein
MLSEEAKIVLEKWRYNEMQAHEAAILCDAMLDLYPFREIGGVVIRWDDEITPERLLACGGSNYPSDDYIAFRGGEIELAFWCKTCQWDISHIRSGSGVGHRNSCWRVFRPRNMGEVWSLMERCGIEVTT